MKREIKFRGKRLDNGEWVYGHYTEGSPNYHYITNPSGAVWQVDPETVGEFTGLHDKKRTKEFPDGQPIWEGDILEFGGLGYVKYDEDRFLVDCGILFTRISTQHEVIGNIHDNPELLK